MRFSSLPSQLSPGLLAVLLWPSVVDAQDVQAPQPYPAARYEALWSQSLFRPKNVSTPGTPNRYVLVGLMELEGRSLAALRDASTGILLNASPEGDGEHMPRLVRVIPGAASGETGAEIEYRGQTFVAAYAKGGETPSSIPAASAQQTAPPLSVPQNSPPPPPVSSTPTPRTAIVPQKSTNRVAPGPPVVPSHRAPTMNAPRPPASPAPPPGPTDEEPLLIEPPIPSAPPKS